MAKAKTEPSLEPSEVIPDPAPESVTEVVNLDYKASWESAAMRAHKLEAVLKAHNIAVDLKNISSEGLTISDGVVYGDVEYKAVEVKAPTMPQPTATSAITMDQIDSMSADEINANWDEIAKVLEASTV